MSKRMNKRIKTLWIKALRSGKYKQGKSKLHHAGRFCCLGVLCDLHRKSRETGKSKWNKLGYLGRNDALPYPVYEWASLTDADPMIGMGPEKDYLSAHNDNNKKSFREIAKLIEEYL